MLIHTGVDKLWVTKKYFTDGHGMSLNATSFLIEQGIKVMGIDAYGFDRPFGSMLRDYFRTKDNTSLWPAHILGRKLEYVPMERLYNLDLIPQKHSFKIACFPIKVINIGASWVRAVAIINTD